MTISDFLTTAQYTRGFAHGSTTGLLYAISERLAEDLHAPDLSDRVRRIYSTNADAGCEAARACNIFAEGWTAGYLKAVATFDRKMTGEQIADCIATATSSLACLA